MKRLATATAATAFAIAAVAEISAQPNPALGDTSIRPADITCQDLMSAGEEERAGIVYFIAGYQAWTSQGPSADSGSSSSGGTNAGASTEAAQPAGAAAGGDSNQATAAGADASSDAAGAGDVALARSFFAKPIAEILKECESTGSGAENAGAVIKRAQGDSQ